jgi:excinuclease UvrABC ATPase subunit
MPRTIEVRGARTHNLKNIDVTVPHRALTVITGVSGSGKSSLAFDTLYAEGQMRYVESLSAYSRQFLEQMERPDVDSITGLPPAIALEQKNTVKNARSTVGTATEIADYLRLLFASVGQTICPTCGIRVVKHTVAGAVDEVMQLPTGSRLLVLAPVSRTSSDVPAAKESAAPDVPDMSASPAGGAENAVPQALAGKPPVAPDESDGPSALPDSPPAPQTQAEEQPPDSASESAAAVPGTPTVNPQSAIDSTELVAGRNPQSLRPWDSLRRELERMGFRRLYIAGRVIDTSEVADDQVPAQFEVVIDRLVLEAPASEESAPDDPSKRAAGCSQPVPPAGAQRQSADMHNTACKQAVAPGASVAPGSPAAPVATAGAAHAEQAATTSAAGSRSRLAESLETAFKAGRGCATVAVLDASRTEVRRIAFDIRFNCRRCGREFPEPDPQLFSFNSAVGACPTCEGFGRVSGLDPEKIIPDPRRAIDAGAIICWQTPAYKQMHRECRHACHARGIRTDVPYIDLPESARRFIWDGDEAAGWPGVRGFFDWLETKRYKVHVRVMIARYRGYYTCPACGGQRLRTEALSVFVGGKRLSELAVLPVKDLRRWFDALLLAPEDAEKAVVLLREIRHRLAYLDDVGLDYLTLDRQTRTLSGGESQRINLASALGSSLTNTLYVLDEPTVGLHARDTQRLIGILRSLIGKGNTVAVVEHDPEVIEAAQHVIDLGPGAGEDGGSVIFQGPRDALAECPASQTAVQLRTHAGRAMAPYARRAKGWITMTGARQHNLKNLNVRIPLGVLCGVTGVSGSGKTTLVHSCLYGQFKHRLGESVEDVGALDGLDGLDTIDDLILVDQSAIGQSTRSNPVTYVKAYAAIRGLLAETPKARVAGITAADFSFNVTGGRCEVCKGVGTVTYDMVFMADVTVVCQECGGKRFKKKVLDVRWNGRNIDDILDMTVDQAMAHFAEHEAVTAHLRPLADVGLGYLRLGQNTASLSGGEAQRLKLASYLAAPKKG